MAGGLICAGVAGMILYQSIENIGMGLGLLPVIGITLPFVSYGGSSMVCTLMELGIVFSVASHREQMTYDREDKKNAN